MHKIFFLTLLGLFTLNTSALGKDSDDYSKYLNAWNPDSKYDTDTTISVNSIIRFVKGATQKGPNYIPPQDRIAVFDMDGTIATEKPFSMELFVATQILKWDVPKCNANADSLQKAVISAFKGGYLPGNLSSDSLISLAKIYTQKISNQCIPSDQGKGRPLNKQFYLPMMQLIRYLTLHQFKVHIVSGSSQQFILGVVQNVDSLKDLAPSRIIGSLQKYKKLVHSVGSYPKFYLDTLNFLSDISQGKAINIYNRIGQKPVFAFGNTVDDLDMFSFTSSNTKYQTMSVLLNHDSEKLEFFYPPFNSKNDVCKNWNQKDYCGQKWSSSIFNKIMRDQKWKKANIGECFLTDSVFVK